MDMPASQAADLGRAFAESGLGAVLDQLDRELIGLRPVKARIREIAALLLVDRVRGAVFFELQQGANKAGFHLLGSADVGLARYDLPRYSLATSA